MDLWKEIRLSRQEIYDRIWAAPMAQVAPQLGLSDVGLAKLCRRSGIPIPPQGFHLKAPGRVKDRLVVALPKNQDNTSRIFDFRAPADGVLLAKERSGTELAELRANAPPKLPAEQERRLESRLSALGRRLDAKRVDDRGVMISPSVTFAIRVAPASLTRALQILRCLSTQVFALGGELVERGGWAEDSLCFKWKGYDFAFRVEEASTRQEIPPDKQKQRAGAYSFASDAWLLVPTGKLSLEGRGPGYGRLTLRDGKEQIEDRIDGLLDRMFEQVVVQREEDRIKALREERAIAHLRKKDEVLRSREFDELCRRQLHLEARQFRQAQTVRCYVEAVEAAGYSDGSTSFHTLDAWSDWIERGKRIAAALDPISSGRAGTTPAYPEPKEISKYPAIYLRYDTPEEAEEEMKRSPWLRY